MSHIQKKSILIFIFASINILFIYLAREGILHSVAVISSHFLNPFKMQLNILIINHNFAIFGADNKQHKTCLGPTYIEQSLMRLKKKRR